MNTSKYIQMSKMSKNLHIFRWPLYHARFGNQQIPPICKKIDHGIQPLCAMDPKQNMNTEINKHRSEVTKVNTQNRGIQRFVLYGLPPHIYAHDQGLQYLRDAISDRKEEIEYFS